MGDLFLKCLKVKKKVLGCDGILSVRGVLEGQAKSGKSLKERGVWPSLQV